MFTGIVQAVGRIAKIKPAAQSAVVAIDAGGLDLGDVAVGDSIACNGVCLTVTSRLPNGFTVDISPETLAVTAGFVTGAAINLEKALRLSDRLSGHIVSGHVDGAGTVEVVESMDGNRAIVVRFPAELARYIARKGSIALNGVSLTVNAVTGNSFSVNLIPHTLAVTNLNDLKQGDRVNLEIDLIARYVERIVTPSI
jgi:riboflavin synthase